MWSPRYASLQPRWMVRSKIRGRRTGRVRGGSGQRCPRTATPGWATGPAPASRSSPSSPFSRPRGRFGTSSCWSSSPPCLPLAWIRRSAGSSVGAYPERAVTNIGLLCVGFLALFAWLVIPQAVRQAHDLAREFPGYLDRLRTSTGTLGTLEAKYHLSERLRQASSRSRTSPSGRSPASRPAPAA
jgi:hypothetical protein